MDSAVNLTFWRNRSIFIALVHCPDSSLDFLSFSMLCMCSSSSGAHMKTNVCMNLPSPKCYVSFDMLNECYELMIDSSKRLRSPSCGRCISGCSWTPTLKSILSLLFLSVDDVLE
jgi:hypothetical protein